MKSFLSHQFHNVSLTTQTIITLTALSFIVKGLLQSMASWQCHSQNSWYCSLLR